jgi:hypothetical protein
LGFRGRLSRHIAGMSRRAAAVERRARHIDTDAGELQRTGRITELPATYLKRVEVVVTPAESDLQRSVELGQRCLFGDPNPARYRRRYAAQAGTPLHRSNEVVIRHSLTLALAADQLKAAGPAPGMDHSRDVALIEQYLAIGAQNTMRKKQRSTPMLPIRCGAQSYPSRAPYAYTADWYRSELPEEIIE